MMMSVFLFQVKHETQKFCYSTDPRSCLGPKKINDFQHTRSSSVYLLGRFCSRCAASGCLHCGYFLPNCELRFCLLFHVIGSWSGSPSGFIVFDLVFTLGHIGPFLMVLITHRQDACSILQYRVFVRGRWGGFWVGGAFGYLIILLCSWGGKRH